MTERHLPFFVYGTLRAGERNHALLAGRTASWTPATLPGTLLFEGPGYPFAVADPAGAAVVHGDVVDIPPEHFARVLADLDRLESYAPDDPGSLYLRVVRDVHTARGPRAAWLYLAGPSLAADLLDSAHPIPTGTWPLPG
ncbi:gamma-glutamylcyclotransferase family protein [Actinacidiphila acidipaludis]|uniref:gamma-glutamylcyclotransferase family protein n=1 Tax=Actinacidiphila acidipaludis TaxID=2873382 RepID=UPI0027DEB0A8|nr:gamma-glutamylcyclotransferase family protein [Streptomyces acidipaludis]